MRNLREFLNESYIPDRTLKDHALNLSGQLSAANHIHEHLKSGTGQHSVTEHNHNGPLRLHYEPDGPTAHSEIHDSLTKAGLKKISTPAEDEHIVKTGATSHFGPTHYTGMVGSHKVDVAVHHFGQNDFHDPNDDDKDSPHALHQDDPIASAVHVKVHPRG